jgi:hypothetical protein
MGLLDDAIREHLDLKRARGADPADIERMEREALGPVRREPTIGSVPFDPPQQHEPEYHEPEPHVLGPEELEDYGYHDSTAPHPHHHHTHAPHLDLDGEHEHREDVQLPIEPDQPPKRRFLRRTRPASLAEPVQPPEPLHEEAIAFEHEEVIEHYDLTAHDEPAHGEGAEPPHLQFDHPPRRPRFTPEPPVADEPVAEPLEHPDEQETTVHEVAESHAEPQPTREFDVESNLDAEPDDDDVLEETPEFLQDTPEHDRLWFEQRPPKDFDFDG